MVFQRLVLVLLLVISFSCNSHAAERQTPIVIAVAKARDAVVNI